MHRLIVKDKKYRKNFIKNEIARFSLKTVLKSFFYLSKNYNLKSYFFLNYILFNSYKKFIKISRLSLKCRIKNRCVITGSAKSIIRFFRISRQVFREFVALGFLKGIKKASW